MAKKDRQTKPEEAPEPNRAVEAATIAWMLSVMTTLVCSAVSGTVWLAIHNSGGNPSAVLFAQFMHFSALVTSVVSLILMTVVLKARTELPPTSIIIGSVVIAALPLLGLLL